MDVERTFCYWIEEKKYTRDDVFFLVNVSYSVVWNKVFYRFVFRFGCLWVGGQDSLDDLESLVGDLERDLEGLDVLLALHEVLYDGQDELLASKALRFLGAEEPHIVGRLFDVFANAQSHLDLSVSIHFCWHIGVWHIVRMQCCL